jgi:hypothetical protein
MLRLPVLDNTSPAGLGAWQHIQDIASIRQAAGDCPEGDVLAIVRFPRSVGGANRACDGEAWSDIESETYSTPHAVFEPSSSIVGDDRSCISARGN